jgi:positive regulator of sigma E activity
MVIDWSRVTPVLVSILIIIAIAVLRQYSKTIAAIAATMPVNIPLGMWIALSGPDAKQADLIIFNEAVMLNLLPTVGFTIAAWLSARAGNSVVTSILIGYVVWAVGLGILLIVRAVLNH